jgi:membrane protease YdiL (CAAX protease family)
MNSTGIDIVWMEGDMIIALPMILCLIGFAAFWFVSKASKINDGSVKNVLFTKYWGLCSMGIIPAIIALQLMPQYALADYGLTYNSSSTITSLVAVLILAALAMPIVFLSAKKPYHQLNYPQIREKNWTRSLMLKNCLGWSAYLLGYEFLFRGVLLFPLVDAIGVWPAVAINTAMCSATHIPKGLDETICAAFLGVVLCLITLMTGTLWVAIFVHIIIALTNSFSSIYHNPEMKFVK